MSDQATRFAVFVKPWKSLPLPELAAHVRRLGFDLIELPVRPGFPCRPESIERDLPNAVTIFADQGVEILNVTVDLPLDDERLYAACAANGIGMNRVMFRRDDMGYWEAETAARRALDAAIPFCEQYGIRIGVQHHSGAFVPIHSLGLHRLVESYDPQYVGAIWDPAHNGLQGEDPISGLEIVASHLCMVNLKNAYWERLGGATDEPARWQPRFCPGNAGLADWSAVAQGVRRVGYTGPITFSAEYSAEHEVDGRIVADLAYARQLFG